MTNPAGDWADTLKAAPIRAGVVELDRSYPAPAGGPAANFPFGASLSAYAIFDKAVMARLQSIFGARRFRLAAVTVLAIDDRERSFDSCVSRNGLMGDQFDARFPSVSVAIPVGGLQIWNELCEATVDGLVMKVDLSPLMALVYDGSHSLRIFRNPYLTSDATGIEDEADNDERDQSIIVGDYVANDAPGTSFQAWWSTCGWEEWRDFVVGLEPALLSKIGFPEPSNPYWKPQTIEAVSSRFPGLALQTYLDVTGPSS